MVKSVLEMELSKPTNDFSLAQLVQIFEASELAIIRFSLEEAGDLSMISLAFSSGDIQSCLSSLRRYGFEIISVDGKDAAKEQLEAHAAYLNTYLNI